MYKKYKRKRGNRVKVYASQVRIFIRLFSQNYESRDSNREGGGLGRHYTQQDEGVKERVFLGEDEGDKAKSEERYEDFERDFGKVCFGIIRIFTGI